MNDKFHKTSVHLGDLVALGKALTYAAHCAGSGGHSEIIYTVSHTAGQPQWTRLVRMTPCGVAPRRTMRGGVWWHGLVMDESADHGATWEPFKGFTPEDVADPYHMGFEVRWRSVAHTCTDKTGRCASRLCAQLGHGDDVPPAINGRIHT